MCIYNINNIQVLSILHSQCTLAPCTVHIHVDVTCIWISKNILLILLLNSPNSTSLIYTGTTMLFFNFNFNFIEFITYAHTKSK